METYKAMDKFSGQTIRAWVVPDMSTALMCFRCVGSGAVLVNGTGRVVAESKIVDNRPTVV